MGNKGYGLYNLCKAETNPFQEGVVLRDGDILLFSSPILECPTNQLMKQTPKSVKHAIAMQVKYGAAPTKESLEGSLDAEQNFILNGPFIKKSKITQSDTDSDSDLHYEFYVAKININETVTEISLLSDSTQFVLHDYTDDKKISQNIKIGARKSYTDTEESAELRIGLDCTKLRRNRQIGGCLDHRMKDGGYYYEYKFEPKIILAISPQHGEFTKKGNAFRYQDTSSFGTLLIRKN